ncbi:MAG: hypothetical protein ACOCW1_05260 [Chitinispirillaceae bacterium]
MLTHSPKKLYVVDKKEFKSMTSPGTYSVSAFDSRSNVDSAYRHPVTVEGNGAFELVIEL